MTEWIVLAGLVALGGYVIALFNGLVRHRNLVREGWSGIDVQLHRRSDLIPNLVQTVKAYATHERTLFEDIVTRRNAALTPGAVPEKAAAEQALQGSLGRLFAIAEAYPQLKADQNFLKLQEQLAEVEDQLQYARRYFNGTVRDFNIRIQSFPDILLARCGGDKGMTVLVAQLSLVPAMVVASLLLVNGVPRSVGGYVVTGFACVFSFLVGSGGYHLLISTYDGWVNVVPASVPLLVMPIASSAFGWMKSHTFEGRKIADQIEGFKQYLGVAEEDRLNALNPPEKTPELFEKFLPYAVALDCENAWALKFAALLAAVPIADDWYAGTRDRNDSPASFATFLGSQLHDTISSASTPPGTSGSGGSDSSSSGSDGGGSSGGGGGGGGGDGW